MTRLWDWEREHGSRVLRKTTLEGELGGAERIVRNHVDRALAGLGAEEVETATDIFHDLVTPSGVKVAHTAEDLAQMSAHSEDTVESVVRKLYVERILRAVDPAPGTTNARYELFHDRLAAPVLEWRVQQENARLERAKREAELEAHTQRAQARRFKRRARIMLGLAISLLVLLAAVVVLLQYARDKSATASRENRVATSFGLTTRAQSQLTSRPDVSLLLYLAAYGESPQPAAERNLVATLQSLRRSAAIGVLHGHTDAVASLAFSPRGTTLASASSDRAIRLWTVTPAAHYPLGPPLRADGPLYSVAFSPNGETLASGSFNHVIVWSVRRHAELDEIRYQSGAINTVAFAARGNLLAAGGSDGTVLLWNAVTHQRTLLTVPGGASVRSVAFNPSGDVLAAGSGRSVALWNVGTRQQLGQPLTGPTGPVYSVAFSPDRRTIAAGGESGTIVRWDVTSHRERPPTLISRKAVFGIAFSPDGQALAAGETGTTVVWNLAGGHIRRQGLPGHRGGIYGVAFSPDGHVLASAGADRTITLWDYPVPPRFGIPLVRHPGPVKAVAISPDGLTIASGDADGMIFLTNRPTGKLERILNAGAGAGRVRQLAFERAGRVLVAAYDDGTIRLWDLATGRQLGAPLRGHFGPVDAIALDPAGTVLASGGADGTVRLWDLRSHRELGRPLRAATGRVFAVAFSPNGRVLASGGDGRAIRLWNPRTGLPLDPPLIAQDDSVFTLAFSPGGRVLAAGGADDTIHLWAVHPHAYAPSGTLTGHSSYVRSIAFSPDGQTLASGSTDTTIRLWDVATGIELGTPLTGDGGAVEDIVSSNDGQFLVSGSLDQTVRLWQAVRLPGSVAELRHRVCSFVGAGLSRAEWAQYASNIPYRQACPRSTPS
jgi:WD40 repeat protein